MWKEERERIALALYSDESPVRPVSLPICQRGDQPLFCLHHLLPVVGCSNRLSLLPNVQYLPALLPLLSPTCGPSLNIKQSTVEMDVDI
ncbi:hypothetical protein PAMP_001322 [Pampus punctatissimus]